ncbi:DNA cytosine methyltransferase [Gammaproteobacteria bacterium]|nr:DNA cytosine methyltransferase [Gammaproteobacteria bacterium]
MKKLITIIDLFAGPGGLGEGFSKRKIFGSSLSIEMDPVACKTLKLRKLFRSLKSDDKKFFYDLLEEGSSFSWERAEDIFEDYAEDIETSVWNHELGSKNTSQEQTIKEIKRRLKRLGHVKENPLIIIGGPPCQAYSLIGRASRKQMKIHGTYKPEEDTRHFLYEWYLNIIPSFKPHVFVMENVPGILSSKVNGQSMFPKILEDLEGLGYDLLSLNEGGQRDLFSATKDFKLKASDYGVPQDRERIIIIGVRKDLNINKDIYLKKANEFNSVSSVISDLPLVRSGLSKIDKKKAIDDVVLWKEQLRQKYWNSFEGIDGDIKKELKKFIKDIHDEKFQFDRGEGFLKSKNYGNTNNFSSDLKDWYIDNNLKGYLNHESRSHMDCDLRRYLFNSVFTKVRGRAPLLTDYPDFLLPDHKNKKSGNHKDRFRTIAANKPSKTITSHISKDGHAFIHPDPLQCRSLTVREAARIQSFPDNYFFCGNRTQQYHQVGNAVPPYLAYQIAEVVHKILDE